MWPTPDWAKLSIAEVREYDNLALDLGTGLGIPRRPYNTGNIADFFDKYETDDGADWTYFDTERIGSTSAHEITWKDGKGKERVAHVRGYIRQMSFVRTIEINEAAFLFDPKCVSMGEYRARAQRKRALDEKLHGYVPGFRFQRHAPSPFGPPEHRFRKFDPNPSFGDKDRYGFVQFHSYR